MSNFMEAQPVTPNNNILYVIMIIVAVLLVVSMVIIPMFSNKKRRQQIDQQVNSLAVGDVVETVGGVIGTVIDIKVVGTRKELTIQTGGELKSALTIDVQALYAILEKATKTPELPKAEDNDQNKDGSDESTQKQTASSDIENVTDKSDEK